MVLPISAKDEKYANYVRNSDKYKIMDNGAAEESQLTDKEFIKLAIDLKIDELIIPDALCDSGMTMLKMRKFFESLPRDHHFRLMGVPQGKKISEWMSCYKTMIADERVDVIGFSKFSIPVAFRERTLSNAICANRRNAQGYIAEWHHNHGVQYKPIHLLGLRNPAELAQLSGSTVIRSCDSCLPILSAWKHKDMREMMTAITPIKYFAARLSELELINARQNIDAIRERCS